MPRPILDEAHIHEAIRKKVAESRLGLIREVQAAVATHNVVVVGMGMNPVCSKARRALDAAGVPHHYLEYGNYFNTWRERNTLKMWTGWPTFPMIFVKGVLVGGHSDLALLIQSGELATLQGKP